MTVAFVTMVYDDEIFLKIWVDYYARFTDRSRLFVITHGPQPYAHSVAEGCNIVEIERDPKNPNLDQDRFKFISQYCSQLTTSHDRVIYNDVDELVVLDPLYPGNVVQYIESLPPDLQVVTPLGLEVIHRKEFESDLDFRRGILAQRRFVRLNAWYTKPCITNVPIVWGPDGHGSSYPGINLDSNLYLFHLKWFDNGFHIRRHQDRLKLRFQDADGEEVVVGAGSWGWSELTYMLVTNGFFRQGIDRKNKGFDYSDERKRIVDSFAAIKNRNPQQPLMYKINWFVDGDVRYLPERFANVV